MPKISTTKKDDRRRQILTAAMACFARKGFHPTTILDICAEAELSAGAVYSYFASKDAIIEALAERGRARAARRESNVPANATTAERMRRYLQELAQPGNARVSQFDLQSWAEAIGNRHVRDIHLKARAVTIDALTDVSRSSAEELGIAPAALAELVLAVIVGCETRRAIQPAADLGPALEALYALLRPRTSGDKD